ncbi:hypothetical protein [Xiamenia xianingshaonis]|uniref:Uncharacterized protein n=1 Tax=Xiamenia xianingshaonis TaxID=2682776 RepID=A0A9E6SVD7_9ACTN|nr:hypothetical protein [Xiamenia xianingshaonis]NHM13734.1 hypothetical protein [Xiamenia xianingshaonis]QTU85102.1 hypothetical protein J7S26_04135 [Xiamenia xianingshaonis]
MMETLYPGALASLAKEVSGDAADFAEAGLADIVGLIETGTPGANFGKSVDPGLIAALAEEDPDFVILDDTSFPSSFFSCEGEVYELWKGVRAVGEGRFAVAPALMHSILGSAIFAQSIGILWIAYAVAPFRSRCDIASEMATFYQLFYELVRDEAAMARLLGMAVEND